jgi:O-antigen/teichoic acid export membrane protein
VDEISYSLFQPVIFVAIIAAILAVSGAVVRARGNESGGERMADLAFGLTLLGGAYVVILLLITIFSEPDVLYDAIVIILVVSVFFLALLGLLFGVFELILSRGGRSRKPRESD